MSNGQCPCDERIHPQRLAIHAGLTRIPRQIAGFPGFRRAMLAELSKHAPLGPWRARSEDDLGIMLLEMWAHVCDVLAFYDEVIAHECYLRTARLRPSLRRLVDLLGYVPRPAVAASVLLAAFAEGRKPITRPAGTTFRSQAFHGQPPQIFELDKETTVHALNNQWEVAPAAGEGFTPHTADGSAGEAHRTGVESDGLSSEISQLLLAPEFTDLREGDVVLLRIGSQGFTHATHVSALSRITGADGRPYDQVAFAPTLRLPSNGSLREIEVLRGTQTASLWTMEQVDLEDPPVVVNVGGTSVDSRVTFLMKLVLDGLYRQIKPGQCLVVARAAGSSGFGLTLSGNT